MGAMPKCSDPVILDLWHAIGAVAELTPNTVHQTVLLEEPIGFTVDAAGQAFAWRSHPAWPPCAVVDPMTMVDLLPTRSSYGYVWTSLGTPTAEIFPIPEYFERGRRNLNAATVGVNVSAPRAIETGKHVERPSVTPRGPSQNRTPGSPSRSIAPPT